MIHRETYHTTSAVATSDTRDSIHLHRYGSDTVSPGQTDIVCLPSF